MIILTGKNIIGAEESALGKDSFQARNPENNKELETVFYEATTEEINKAVAKAETAFPVYRSMSNEQRARFLDSVADGILALGDQLIQHCMTETALPETRLTGERMRTVNQLRLFASVVREGSWTGARIDTGDPERKPAPGPDIRQMRIPLGPAAVFGASNFPFAFSVAGGDTTSALAAGCPVLFKAHPLHPGTSELVAKAIVTAAKKTGMPDGVFSLLHGASNRVGMELVMHPKITAVGFTGSFRGGKALFDAANKREVPIPVFAEMGSVNPVFVLPGALSERKEQLAKGYIGSLTLGVGQFCTNPGLMIVAKGDDTGKLQDMLKEQVVAANAGTMLSEGIKNNFEVGVKRFTASKDVQMLGTGAPSDRENKVTAAIFSTPASYFLQHRELASEVFGPAGLMVVADSREEMLKVASGLEGHLTATLHGTPKDLEEYNDLVRILERKAGRLIFNGFPTGVEVNHAMVHGGPYPATTAPQTTSVGTLAIQRFSRPVCYQDFPDEALPPELKNNNPLKIWRMVDGEFSRKEI